MRAAIIAFSMYSRIPMPMFEWKEEDMKYAMCFFPAIGAVIGAVFFGMYLLLDRILTGKILAAGILLAVPLFITGGIHMDGFMDTCDARASYGDREKKLGILKDTHTGAFAVIFGGLYLILYAAACTELDEESALLTAIGFILSRALSGLSTATLDAGRFYEGCEKEDRGSLHARDLFPDGISGTALWRYLRRCCCNYNGFDLPLVSPHGSTGIRWCDRRSCRFLPADL